MAWSEHALATLRDAGHRSGGARRAVVDVLGRQRCAVTAQELFDAVRGAGRPVGIATVYRVLELLAAHRLLQRVDLGGGGARYEPVDPSGGHHHHFVCNDCGRVEPFADASLERTMHRLGERVGYAIVTHEVVLRGSCRDCAAAA